MKELADEVDRLVLIVRRNGGETDQELDADVIHAKLDYIAGMLKLDIGIGKILTGYICGKKQADRVEKMYGKLVDAYNEQLVDALEGFCDRKGIGTKTKEME